MVNKNNSITYKDIINDLKTTLLYRLHKETSYEDIYGEKEVNQVIEEVFNEYTNKESCFKLGLNGIPLESEITENGTRLIKSFKIDSACIKIKP